jgi:hypothetical protein
MAVVENIRKTTTSLDNECLVADFSFPHPARRFDPMDRRRVPVRVQVTKEGVEETEVRISFNRFEVSLLDALACMCNVKLTHEVTLHRFADFSLPLIPTKYEMDLIWDNKHDEIYEPEALND